ncbi:MAG: tRNA preQ1(34) S-adenosylmethionine ribosyltransferase-isomerase QueA [Peptococcaceae bacterium]|nr:tRNA preQ1(34) S-adenosylmethionine ribosyltransferase-isomerase QueA [Peptococcaceae bacterium]
MKLTDFDYQLPQELIAQDPLLVRDQSRLMVIDKGRKLLEHKVFTDLSAYLNPGDILVINQTKVIPARLIGSKVGTGAAIEVLLLKDLGKGLWETLVKPGRRVKPGVKLIFGEGIMTGTVTSATDQGGRLIQFESRESFSGAINRIGKMPLPPYIKNYPEDPLRYQTVYANEEGSVAAPTAGLHFTPELLGKIRHKGIRVVPVIHHVGLGTFRPVAVDNIEEHYMHKEYYNIPEETAELINSTRAGSEGRIIGVGTTSVRCLESAVDSSGRVSAGSGETEVFIYPGYKFKVIQGMITNFHLPKSTLIMMVSALAGRELIMDAYMEAVKREYRFFSFGDAMLIY